MPDPDNDLPQQDWEQPGVIAEEAASAPPQLKTDSAMGLRTESAPAFNPDDYLKDESPAPEKREVSGTVSFGTNPQVFDPDQFLQMEPNTQKRVIALPAAPETTTRSGLLGPTGNALNAEGNTIVGSIGDAVQFAGGLLSQLDKSVDQTDDTTNPYIQLGIKIRSAANTMYPLDPQRPYSTGAGNLAGNVLPVAVTGGAAAIPGASRVGLAVGAKAIGSGMFGGQMYAEASDKGVGPLGASAAGLSGVGLGSLLPSVSAFHASPAVASATWDALAKNVGFGALLNASKSFAEMAGIGTVSNEISNAVLPDDQQAPQGQLLWSSIQGALPMAFVGAVGHGISQTLAETSVSKAARGTFGQQDGAIGPAQDKASFITNTSQAINAIANGSMTPQEKMSAVTSYMSQFSPDVQKVITAHVQNVSSAVAKIEADNKASLELAKTNPITAPILAKSQAQATIANMVDKAEDIDAQAEEAEKAANEALPSSPEPTASEEPDSEIKPQLPPQAPVERDPLKIQSIPDARLDTLLDEAQGHATNSLAEGDNEDAKFWQGAINELHTEKARRQNVEAEKNGTLDYDEYGNVRRPVASEPTPPNVSVEVGKPEAAKETPHVEKQGSEAPIQPAPNTGSEAKPEEKAVELVNAPEQESAKEAESPAGVAETSKPEKPLEEQSQEELESTAQAEGIHPGDVAETKSPKGLRDLIAVQRLGKEPVYEKDLVPDGKALVDPRIAKLPKKYADAVQSVINAAKKSGLGGVKNFIVDTKNRNAIAALTRSGNQDTVVINPISALRDVEYIRSKGGKKGDVDFYHGKVFEEEFTHLHAAKAIKGQWVREGSPGDFHDYYNRKMASIYDAMTPTQRKAALKNYDGDQLLNSLDLSKQSSEHGNDLGASRLGEEYFRQVIQRRNGRGITEEAVGRIRANKPLRSILQATVDRFKGILAKIVSDGKSNPALESLIHDYEQALKQPEVTGKKVKASAKAQRVNPLNTRGPPVTSAAPVRDGFYSQLEKVVDEKMPNRQDSTQVRAMLKGNGVKDDELKWSGVDDYLKAHPQATKTDLQKFLNEEGGIKIQTLESGKDFPPKFDFLRTPGGTDYREQIFSLPEGEQNFESPHFPEAPNYLAHTRLSDMVDSEGKQGTLLDEVQSDRLQALRKGAQVPNAPFSKTWPQFVIRKSLNDAVTSGKDWLGWATGDTQESRIPEALRKVADNISWKDGNVVASKAGKPVFRGTLDADGKLVDTTLPPAEGRHLSEVIGHSMANRVTSEPSGRIDSKDFVAGEGVKRLYDEMLPQYVSRYAKKWGVKPELSTTADGTEIWKTPINDAMRKSVIENGQPIAGAKNLAPEHEDIDDSDIWDADYEPSPETSKANLEEATGYTGVPSKKEPESDLKPFLDQPAQAEAQSGPNEKLTPKRANPAEVGEDREEALNQRIEELKDVQIPDDKSAEFYNAVQRRGELNFGTRGDRALAESNAYVKVMLEAKDYQKKNGDLDGFGATRIIQNSMVDDVRRFKRGQLATQEISQNEEAPKKELQEGEDEAPLKTKGYDASETDHEANQQAFEPTGSQADIADLDNPAKRAQNAQVDKNVADITKSLSPYGRRLLEIQADTPQTRETVLPAWVNRAAKEFGIPRVKVIEDMHEIVNRIRGEVEAKGLTAADFVRAAAPALREEGFANQVTNDERVGEDVRQLMNGRLYEQTANKVANDRANEAINRDGVGATYERVLNKILNGKPDEFDSAVAQNLVRRLGASENPNDRLRAAELATAVSVEANRSGKFSQALRMWSNLGADGVIAAYEKIIRPVIDKVKGPLKGTTDAIEDSLKKGREQATEETLDRFERSGLIDRAEEAGEKSVLERQREQNEKPAWQRYMEATAEALSNVPGGKSKPKLKGALEEFASRMQANLKSLMGENAGKKNAAIKKAPISAEAKLGEIYKNEPEYREAWDYAKTHIEAKYADDPDTLELFKDALDKTFSAPIKLHDQALTDELKNRGFTFQQVAKNFESANSLRDSVVKDIAGRLKLNADQKARVSDELSKRFDELYQNARTKNQEALDRAEKIKKANQDSLAQGVPLWTRYTDKISSQLADMVKGSKPSVIKPAMQEFATRVASNLKSLVSESKVTTALEKGGLTTDQKISDIYSNFPEYKEAWDKARNAMRNKIGNDPAKLAEFDAALKKNFDAPIKLQDKLLSEALKTSGISLPKLVREWSGKQNATRDALIRNIQDRLGLKPDVAEKLGNAIYTRFQERLQSTRKSELQKLLKQSGKPKLANEAPSIAKKIFEAVNLGVPDNEAVWNAIADRLKLPKYNQAIADDLRKRANKIQQMIADGKEGFQTDNKTQDMMNVLANEAQKSMSKWKQFGQGQMAVFYGNIFGPSTIARKSISEVSNLISEVGTMAAADMRHGDLLAVPRAYGAVMRGLYQRGGADFRNILATGRGLRQSGKGDYTANDLAERGKIYGTIPILSKLNTPLSLYKYVGRALYGAQAFFYAGNAEARANMVAYRLAMQDFKDGKIPTEQSIAERTQEILGNSPEQQKAFQDQAKKEGLTGREAILRARELSEQQRPESVQQKSDDFATRATFMQEPEGVLGAAYKGISAITNKVPALRLLVPVTRVVSNVFNNFLSYTPVGISGAIRLAREGNADAAWQQVAKITAGGLATMGAASLFGNNVQGGGPKDYQKKKQLMDEGWIPYSVKIGNSYYSYREWPTALMMAGLGNYYDQSKYTEGTKEDLDSRLAVAMYSTGQFALTSSWISSVNTLLNSLDAQNYAGFERAMKNMAGTTAGSLVPFNQSTLKVIDKIFDPKQYPPTGIAGTLMSQVAFARRFDNNNEPALNALGEPIHSSPVSAFYSSQNVDPVWTALGQMGAFIPVASKSTKINGRPITDDEYWQLIQQAGQLTKNQLQMGEIERMEAMDKDMAEAHLQNLYQTNVARVKAQISARSPRR